MMGQLRGGQGNVWRRGCGDKDASFFFFQRWNILEIFE